MSAISRRTHDHARARRRRGAVGPRRRRAHRRSLRADPARSRRHLRTRRDADVCRAAAPHPTFARARIQPQPDLESAVRQRDRAAERSLQAASGRRLQGLAALRRRPRRAAGVALAGRRQAVSSAPADHRNRVRRRLVVRRGVDRDAAGRRPARRRHHAAGALRRVLFDPKRPGGRASTWPMRCIRRRCSPTR